MDFPVDLVYLRINPTCETGGSCHRPHEIEGFRSWWDPRDAPDRANKFGATVGHDRVTLPWSLINSGFRVPVARAIPAINGSLAFDKDGRSGVDLDGFPSFDSIAEARAVLLYGVHFGSARLGQ